MGPTGPGESFICPGLSAFSLSLSPLSGTGTLVLHATSHHLDHRQDIFLLLPGSQIRRLREDAPSNFAPLLYKVFYCFIRLYDGDGDAMEDISEKGGSIKLSNLL